MLCDTVRTCVSEAATVLMLAEFSWTSATASLMAATALTESTTPATVMTPLILRATITMSSALLMAGRISSSIRFTAERSFDVWSALAAAASASFFAASAEPAAASSEPAALWAEVAALLAEVAACFAESSVAFRNSSTTSSVRFSIPTSLFFRLPSSFWSSARFLRISLIEVDAPSSSLLSSPVEISPCSSLVKSCCRL